MKLPTIDAPVYTTELPSNGQKVKFRPFLVKEEKLILLAIEDKTPHTLIEAVKQIINNCTFNELDITSLPISDIEYLMIQLRAKSKGEIVRLDFACTKNKEDSNGEPILVDGMPIACNRNTQIQFNLQEIKVVKSNIANPIRFNDKVGIKLRYPTYETAEKLNVIFDQTETKIDIGARLLYELTDMIFNGDEVFSKKDFTVEDLSEFLDQLTVDQKDKIEEFFHNVPKVVGEVKYTCACGKYSQIIPLEGLQSFLG